MIDESKIAERIAASFVSNDKTWRVYLDKVYAAPEDRPKGMTRVLAETEVKARTREDAARKAWKLKRDKWLPLCTLNSRSRLQKRISLNVGEKGSVSGNASRLTPIRVE